MHTPFFPALRPRLAALGKRVRHLRQQNLAHLEQLLGPWLPPGLLSQNDQGPNSRDRIYSVRRTFFAFLYQVLKPDCPCREIVRQIQALFGLQGQTRVDEGTGAYCQARKRLPLDTLQRLRVARVAAAEKTAQLWLAVADRGFSSYVLLALFHLRSVACLFRLHQARPADLRQGKRLGKNDRLVLWHKPKQKPRWLLRSGWKNIPEQLTLRVLRFKLCRRGYRPESVTLVTPLLDAKEYPAQDLAQLYARRWHIELWFRHIKTSMGMEVLRCKSPQMVHKELEMFLIAYNFIRCLMAQAAALYQVPLERVSFKGTVDSVRQFSMAIAQAPSKKKQKQLIAQLLEVIAWDEVPERPRRREPRAVKRRPKPYQLVNRPRHRMKELQHRSKYRKNS